MILVIKKTQLYSFSRHRLCQILYEASVQYAIRVNASEAIFIAALLLFLIAETSNFALDLLFSIRNRQLAKLLFRVRSILARTSKLGAYEVSFPPLSLPLFKFSVCLFFSVVLLFP